MTGFNWMPRMRPPALQIYDLPTVTTTSTSMTTLARLPVYNTDWIEVVLTVTENPVRVVLTPDSTAGHMTPHDDNVDVGTHSCWVLVHGVPADVPTTLGSHTVLIQVADTGPGLHGTVSAVAKMRVSRRT